MNEHERSDQERENEMDSVESDEEREELAQRGRLQQTEEEEEGNPDEAA